MDREQIKKARSLKLRPNGIFTALDKPYLYQKKMSLIMLLAPRMVVGDDVGMGKTLEAILAASYFKAQRPETRFLVVTEGTAVLQWRDEFATLAPHLKTVVITAQLYPDVPQRVRLMRQHEQDVVITTHSLMYDYSKYLREGLGKRWIFFSDEPDLYKNSDTEAHQRAFNMVNAEDGAARAYGLTACIVGNRLEEAFGILRVIAPGTFESHAEFEREYCVIKRVGGRKKVSRYKNLDGFRKRIAPVYFGRLQTDPEVQQELPDVILKDVPITLNKAQSWKVVEAMDRLIEMPDGEIKKLSILPAMTLAQILTDDPRVKGFDIDGEKPKAFIETITSSLAGQRVAVFSRFQSVINLFEEQLRKKTNSPISRITGRESWEEKLAAKERFLSDGENHTPILLMTRAARRAINLQKGGHLFFLDFPWSYDDYRQLIGRFKRTGSTHRKIGVYRGLGTLHPDIAAKVGDEKTIDHYTLKVIMKKFELFQAITGDATDMDAGDGDLLDIYQEVKNSYRKTA
jgi:SNF2 family DNA or RNA helicase